MLYSGKCFERLAIFSLKSDVNSLKSSGWEGQIIPCPPPTFEGGGMAPPPPASPVPTSLYCSGKPLVSCERNIGRQVLPTLLRRQQLLLSDKSIV